MSRLAKVSVLSILVNWHSPALAQQDECRTEIKALAPEEDDLFGCAVALNEESLLVGSLLDDRYGEDSGAAYLYDRSTGNPSMTTLCPQGVGPGAQFGYSVALSDSFAVVGAPFHDAAGPGAGAAYVFDLGGTGCLAGSPLPQAVSRQDQAGFSVAINGDVIAVGAPGVDGRGAVNLFQHDGSDWGPLEPVTDVDGRPGDGFGVSVALGGGLLIVGAPFADGAGSASGQVYVFEERENGSWLRRHVLRDRDAAAGDHFGFSIAIDGVTVVVGAPQKANGVVYAFTPRKDGPQIVGWNQSDPLIPRTLSADAELGISVAIAGSSNGDKRILVGARSDDVASPSAGAAFIFSGSGVNWSEQTRLSVGAAGDELGLGAAIDGDLAAVGAFKRDLTENGEVKTDAGAAHTFLVNDLGQPTGCLDYGDAPNAYGTRMYRDGARHVIARDPVLFLGTRAPDPETDGQPDSNAAGDDGDGGDDEDGVVFVSDLVPGQMAELEITSSAVGILNAWIDFDGDMTWSSDPDEMEHIFRDRRLPGAESERLSFLVPDSARLGQRTYTRFRFDSHGASGPKGMAADGEVEDYLISIRPRLALSKNADGMIAVPGASLSYTLEYSARVDVTANSVVLTETIPAHTTFDAAESSTGWVCDAVSAGSKCTLDVGDLQGGASGTAIFAVLVDSPFPGAADQILNEATITDANEDFNMDSETTPIDATPVLKVSISDRGVTASPADVIRYILDVRNDGNRSATGVRINETVPENATFNEAWSSEGWSCDDGAPAGTPCTTELENDLAGDGGTVSVVFAVRVDNPVPANVDEITNEVTVTAGNAALDMGSETTPIEATPTLWITIRGGAVTVRPGEIIDYELDVRNVGNRNAVGVMIKETIPEGTSFHEEGSSGDWTCEDGAPAGSSCSYKLVDGLAGGSQSESVAIELAVMVDDPVAANVESIDNTAWVKAQNADSARDEVSTPVDADPILEISKDDGGVTVGSEGTVIYTITYLNSGNQDAAEVEIRESVPENTRFQKEASSLGWSCLDGDPPDSLCVVELGTLKAGEPESTVKFAVEVDAGDPAMTAILNEATIAALNAAPARAGDTTPIVVAPIAPRNLFGKLFLSVDGRGSIESNERSSTYEVEALKPDDSVTVRLAVLMAASTRRTCSFLPISPPDNCRPIADGDVLFEGVPVAWDVAFFPNHVFGSNQGADVTSIVRSKLDTSKPDRIPFTITETTSELIDGVALAVVFDDPTQSVRSTVFLNLVSLDPSGETFTVTLAEPDLDDPDAIADMGLGMASGAQGCAGTPTRNTQIRVNGALFAATAGGTDDGKCEDGARITVGGLGDSNAQPMCVPGENAMDDELYSLLSCEPDPLNRFAIEISNTGQVFEGNNVFLVYFQLSGLAILGRGIILTPDSAVLPAGTDHTVTAKLVDENGDPVSGGSITFEVRSGPNSGERRTETTGLSGEASFTYTGDGGVGVDLIRATFSDGLVEPPGEPLLASNIAVCEWE